MLAFSTRTLKSSGVPARRVQAGGFCVGMLTLACSTPACPRLLVVVRFRTVHRCCVWGAAFLLGSPRRYGVCTVLACSTSGSGRGSWLLQAQSTGCPLCFADASARGVSPRLEEGGGCQPVLRSLCARSPGCGCFCLRVDFQVTVSVRESTLGS